jgi:hypothetical protein
VPASSIARRTSPTAVNPPGRSSAPAVARPAKPQRSSSAVATACARVVAVGGAPSELTSDQRPPNGAAPAAGRRAPEMDRARTCHW